MLGFSGDNLIKEKPREGCPEGCVSLTWCFSDSGQKIRAIGIPRMLPKARGWHRPGSEIIMLQNIAQGWVGLTDI